MMRRRNLLRDSVPPQIVLCRPDIGTPHFVEIGVIAHNNANEIIGMFSSKPAQGCAKKMHAIVERFGRCDRNSKFDSRQHSGKLTRKCVLQALLDDLADRGHLIFAGIRIDRQQSHSRSEQTSIRRRFEFARARPVFQSRLVTWAHLQPLSRDAVNKALRGRRRGK